MHWGTSPGFNTTYGEVQGTANVTLAATQIPQHTHAVIAAQAAAGDEKANEPTSTSFLSQLANRNLAWVASPTTVNTAFSNKAISTNGGSLPHNNMQPYLTLNFCIALFGIFSVTRLNCGRRDLLRNTAGIHSAGDACCRKVTRCGRRPTPTLRS